VSAHDIKPESIEHAYGRIAGCRDYRSQFGVFVPNDEKASEVVVWPIYYRDGDWKRYFRNALRFDDFCEDFPHLCVGLYDSDLRKQSLDDFAEDVQCTRETRKDYIKNAYFAGDYIRVTPKQSYFAKRKDGGY